MPSGPAGREMRERYMVHYAARAHGVRLLRRMTDSPPSEPQSFRPASPPLGVQDRRQRGAASTCCCADVDLGRLWATARNASVPWLAVGARRVSWCSCWSVPGAGACSCGRRASSMSFGALVNSYLVATFFNNFLPSNIGGDVIRIRDTRQARRIDDPCGDRRPVRPGHRLAGTGLRGGPWRDGHGLDQPDPRPNWPRGALGRPGRRDVNRGVGRADAAGRWPGAQPAPPSPPRVGRRTAEQDHGGARSIPPGAAGAGRRLCGVGLRAGPPRGFYAAIAHGLHVAVPLSHLAIVVPLSFIILMLPVSVNGLGSGRRRSASTSRASACRSNRRSRSRS